MIFAFEISEYDLIDFGDKNGRPITLNQATNALVKMKPKWDETVKEKRLDILSGALDIARGLKK
jgi:hypothetical protein